MAVLFFYVLFTSLPFFVFCEDIITRRYIKSYSENNKKENDRNQEALPENLSHIVTGRFYMQYPINSKIILFSVAGLLFVMVVSLLPLVELALYGEGANKYPEGYTQTAIVSILSALTSLGYLFYFIKYSSDTKRFWLDFENSGSK